MRRSGLAATRVKTAGRLAAPRQMPSFKPVPFKQEKFLSMKSRSAETYFNTRKQILKRSAEVQAQVRKLQQDHSTERDDACRDRILLGTPLTPHMADEIDAWNRSLRNLEALQGFVLNDELIYGAISKNMRLGAFPYALDWLRKCARERRIPVSTVVLHDLRVFVDFVQSVLPASNASLTKAHEALLGDALTMAGARAPNTAEETSSASLLSSDEASADETAATQLVNSSPYVRYLFKELYMPLWECLSELGLLPPERSEEAETDWEQLLRSAQRDDVVLDLLGRLCSCSCGDAGAFSLTPASSASASPNATTDGGGEFAPTALQAYTELLLALLQCAAEAKELHLLIELQLIFCILFLEPTPRAEPAPGWRLKKGIWCNTEAEKELLSRFANEFLAAAYYGRLAHQGEISLQCCIRAFSGDVRDAGEEGGVGANSIEDGGQETNIKWEEHGEAQEGEGETAPSSSCRDAVEVEGSVDHSSSPTSSLVVRRQTAVDEVLKQLLQNEASALTEASIYAALALEDAGLIPNGNGTSTSAYRFSAVEVEWMRLHCDVCRRCRIGENVTSELEGFFLPGGVVARSLEASISNVTDQQCFLALVVETLVSVVATSTTRTAEWWTVIARTMAELLLRIEEARHQQQENGEKPLLLLPLYSAVSAMVVLSPLLGKKGNPASAESDGSGLNDTAVLRDDVMRLMSDFMRSVLNQPTSFGNAYSVVLVLLIQMEMWEEAHRVLCKLDEANGEGGAAHGISSVVLDQRVWAWIFRTARDAGRADICLFLRQRREKLFY
ncbi:uncharacterized protein Tco025E_06109 [Trypanosoma conorhini]|uniref:Uncharacterized protein n=1 Tax=Trypanosoma conorhini TaxID=83891 RepID=A0A422P969_9TRYP|nr:uncharacterized protein Tco025E_06109 [Trypanosoma conorhini]RNF14265.1 hypothetical protein Tco025E_06109 [Trypanosoma conorhini]